MMASGDMVAAGDTASKGVSSVTLAVPTNISSGDIDGGGIDSSGDIDRGDCGEW
jgi:hypothetical protein